MLKKSRTHNSFGCVVYFVSVWRLLEQQSLISLFSSPEGSINRHHRRWCRDTGGEENITRSREAAWSRRQPVGAAERQERAAIGRQGLTRRWRASQYNLEKKRKLQWISVFGKLLSEIPRQENTVLFCRVTKRRKRKAASPQQRTLDLWQHEVEETLCHH